MASNVNAPNLPNQEEGVNYHVIPGKQKNSKLFIKGDHAYKLDKAVGTVRYLTCKCPSCNVRAVIKSSFLVTTEGVHTCAVEGASVSMWAATACTGRMKLRAENEGTSYQVCSFSLQNLFSRALIEIPFVFSLT